MRATTIRKPTSPAIRLNLEALDQAAQRHNWVTDLQIANALGIHPANIVRLRKTGAERQHPGATFIAAALHALPELSFYDLFSVSVPHQRERAA